jgi:hypothetical protein
MIVHALASDFPSLAVLCTLTAGAASPPAAAAPQWNVAHSLRGEAQAERFGTCVASAGDVDGDGVQDWIVGAPRSAASAPYAGRASVFSGRDGAELLRFEGDSASDWLGAAVAGAGDVDGDGHADVLVGAPRGTPPAGSAYLFSGRDGSLIHAWQGVGAGDEFGRALAGVGDVDGDGVRDLAVGAPLADGAGTNAGQLTLYSGADGAPIRSFAGATWDQLGRAVAGAGDLDGDGRAEVVVGAPFADVGAFNGGSALVFAGADGALLFAVHGQGIGDQLGFAVAAGGDVDLDGIGDLLLAAPGADAAGIDSGAARLCSGSSGVALFSVPGLAEGEGLSAVAFVPDFTGDGRAEVLVGAASAFDGAPHSGQARVLSGRDGHLLQAFGGAAGRDWFGASVAAGSGSESRFAVGAPGHDDDVQRAGYVQVFAPAAPAHAPRR